jgi:hypothetical protein
MKRLFLLFFLIISLSALYIHFVSCKEGARSGWSIKNIKKMATNANKKRKLDKKTSNRTAKK